MRSRLRAPRFCASLCSLASSSCSLDSACAASAAPRLARSIMSSPSAMRRRSTDCSCSSAFISWRRVSTRARAASISGMDVALTLRVALDGALQVGELGLQRLDFGHDLELARLLAGGALFVQGQALLVGVDAVREVALALAAGAELLLAVLQRRRQRVEALFGGPGRFLRREQALVTLVQRRAGRQRGLARHAPLLAVELLQRLGQLTRQLAVLLGP